MRLVVVVSRVGIQYKPHSPLPGRTLSSVMQGLLLLTVLVLCSTVASACRYGNLAEFENTATFEATSLSALAILTDQQAQDYQHLRLSNLDLSQGLSQLARHLTASLPLH